jgi:hypothetical protein
MEYLDTVRRMLRRWGWSLRRAHKRRRPDVDLESAIRFVFQILYLLAEGVDPADIVDAGETAHQLYPHEFYTWAGRVSEAVQIHVAGNGKRSWTVMGAVTMAGGKHPLVTIVQGKTVRAERRLELDPHGPQASVHSPSG